MLGSDGVPPKRYGVGDVVFFRSGASVKWYVEGYVKKVAFFHLTNAPLLGYAIRAFNKLRAVIRRNNPALVRAGLF